MRAGRVSAVVPAVSVVALVAGLAALSVSPARRLVGLVYAPFGAVLALFGVKLASQEAPAKSNKSSKHNKLGRPPKPKHEATIAQMSMAPSMLPENSMTASFVSPNHKGRNMSVRKERAEQSTKPWRQHRTASGFYSDLGEASKAAGHRMTSSITAGLTRQHSGPGAHAQLEAKYDLGHQYEVGRGGCGTVMAVKHRVTGQTFAMKVVSLRQIDVSIEELQREIEIQRSLDHPNICRVFESFFDEEGGTEMYIIMEMCTGGSLVESMSNHKRGYGERAAATLVEKMLSAVIYCHHHGVVHRDIKLDNFIYENDHPDAEVKLIDFGFAATIKAGDADCMHERLGTPIYMAPEMWSKGEADYDSSVDVWALGVTTYMLLSGERPFYANTRRELGRMIRHDPLRFPSPRWDRISPDAQDFCQSLMQKKPALRLAASAAKDHPWIKGSSTLHKGIDAAHELQSHTEIVASLTSFAEADEFKKIALEVLAFSTPPEALKEMRDLFVKMDTDDSGTVSLAEFREALKLSDSLDEQKIDEIFLDLDVNGSGELDYSEFLSATLSSQLKSVNGPSGSLGLDATSLEAAFNMLDGDGDGYLVKDDLARALDGQTPCLDEQARHAELIEEIFTDADAQGRVDLATFKRKVLNDITADRGEREEGASRTVGLAEMCLGPGASETSPARRRLSKSRPSSRPSSRKHLLDGLEGQNEAQAAAVAHEAARLKALQAEADLAKK